jgi:hypothetical protein
LSLLAVVVEALMAVVEAVRGVIARLLVSLLIPAILTT